MEIKEGDLRTFVLNYRGVTYLKRLVYRGGQFIPVVNKEIYPGYKN
jgi:hypothetical protein